MKKILLVWVVSLPLLLNAQFNADYSLNYYDQVNGWNSFYDSIRTARLVIGDSLMRGVGYGRYLQWKQYWENFMPESGNFQEAFNIESEFQNQLKYRQFLSLQTSIPNALIVSPGACTEHTGNSDSETRCSRCGRADIGGSCSGNSCPGC